MAERNEPAQAPGTPALPTTAPAQGEPAIARTVSLTTLFAAATVTAVLYLGQEIFLPLAVAVLITFALAPAASALRRRGMPRMVSVLTVVTLAFLAIGMFLLIVVGQIGTLAERLPSFQSNIVTKLDALQAENDNNRLVAQLTRMATAINSEIGSSLDAEDETETRPMRVEVVEQRNAFQVLSDLVVPLISPVGTAGLVIVVVIFMLLEREDLRDRFIRLVGTNDIHRTTQVLEEAGSRVAYYLLTQLLVNTIYAVPIGIGLWLIGVPNAALWGMLTLILRFVPYIGSVLAAVFPLFLAFAVSPDWSAVLWTAALFLVVELITSNVIEPWLYGTRTGVSPLAIIVAAIFWTWIWGPLGLVLSTPLTVCLVVLGRHMPQFAVFDILFGDRPALADHARLYQRLLVGDVSESTFRAEAELENAYLADYHRDVTLPALLLAQSDHGRGAMLPEQQTRLARALDQMLDSLESTVADELAEAEEELASPDPDQLAPVPLSGIGKSILSVGGRSALDDAAAAAFAQAARAEGANAVALTHDDLTAARFAIIVDAGADCVLLNFLDPDPVRGSILHLRRIKRAAPAKRVGVILWDVPPTLEGGLPLTRPTEETRQAILATGADFCVSNMEAALAEAFREQAPAPLPAQARKPPRKRMLSVVAQAAAG